jgi:type III restriction enzyme
LAPCVITNDHAFMLRARGSASWLTRNLVEQGRPRTFRESPAEMVRRACRELGNKKNIVVLDDEAHHRDYPRREAAVLAPAGETPKEKLTARNEARRSGATSRRACGSPAWRP